MRGLFVTGTDTGAGKSILSAALVAAMAADGERVRAHKPVVTGLEDQERGGWPADHELLAAAARMRPEEVAPLRYGPAVSPHLAAELAGEEISAAAVIAAARGDLAPGARANDGEQALIVEGVGGLLVPITKDFSVCELAAALALPLLLAARPGLGTINHTLLTLRVARAAGLEVRAVVLTPWPERPSAIERSNRDTVARLGAVEVATLERLADPGPGPLAGRALDRLARAGEKLPWRRWLADPQALARARAA